MLNNIEMTNAPDKILRSLKDAIMQGQFVPGERITLEGLSVAFGTSHMPVREALRQLVALGALRRERTRSLAIPAMSAKDFRELLRVRLLLEGPAAELAAEHLQASDIDTLKRIDREMDLVLKGKSVDKAKYFRLNQEFHFTVYRCALCPPLVRVIEGLWLQVGPYVGLYDLTSRKTKPHALHGVVIRALENGDGPGAREAMERELSDGGGQLLPVITKLSAAKATRERRPSRRVRARRNPVPAKARRGNGKPASPAAR